GGWARGALRGVRRRYLCGTGSPRRGGCENPISAMTTELTIWPRTADTTLASSRMTMSGLASQPVIRRNVSKRRARAPARWGRGAVGARPPRPRSGLRAFLDDQDRASRVTQDLLRHRAEQEPLHAAPAAGADDHQVRVVVVRGRDDLVGRRARGRGPRHARELFVQLSGGALERLVELPAALGL